MSLTVHSGGASVLLPATVGEAMTLAKMMAENEMIPKEFKGRPANVLMVIELAMRFGMSPFAMTQEVSVVQGKLMLSGKIAAAALHSSGVLSGRLSYEYSGTDSSRQITVSGTLRGETKPRSVTVRLADAKTANQMWTKQPDQQLAYHGARVWGRRHAPEVLLGVYSPEEFDGTPAQAFDGITLDAEKEPASGKLDTLERAIESSSRDPEDQPQQQDNSADEARANAIRFIQTIQSYEHPDDLIEFNRRPKVVEYRAWIKTSRPDLDAMIREAESEHYNAIVQAQQDPVA